MWWDLVQAGQISELEEQIEAQQKQINELKDNVEMLSKWIIFLTGNKYEYGTVESRSLDEESKEGCTQGTGETGSSPQDSSKDGQRSIETHS